MPTQVYSSLLIDYAGLVGSAGFLVPGGYVCVVRDIDVVTPAGAGSVIEAGVGGHAVFWVANVTSAVLYTYNQFRGRQVINAGDQLVIQVVGSPSDVRASGYLLSLP